MATHRIRRFLGNALLNIAALGGMACIVLVALAYAFNITLIMFKTGSMGPTIPAGSVAVVKEIPASEISVGDIVTVDREAMLPVTHRVTSISHGPAAEQRIITMKGDANDAEDPAPYTVANVRLTMAHVPELAKIVVWFGNPYILGGLTSGAAILVTWAFWPRDHENTDGDEDDGGTGGDGAGRRRKHGRRSARTARAASLTGVFCAVVIGGVVHPAAPAHAAESEHVVSGKHLRLTSISDPGQTRNMVPGVPVQWQVGVIANAPHPGEVRIGLAGSGAESMQVDTTVAVCTEPWVDGNCSGRITSTKAFGTLEQGGPDQHVATMPADEERWLLFDVALPEAAAPLAGDSIELKIHADGSGDKVGVALEGGLPQDLPTTGAEAGRVLWLGAGAIVTGLLLALTARVVKRGGDDD
ncbi:signal peptidase I [Arthrobacter crystallopoietes]|uniref:signal peptidase I n=1 Tax=Crystallibacter crystallopoietes TaxID=37928 RepID=UPI001ABDC94A|nr:signal peptidase I [Arthrobacter crystallopoietes]QTG79532.1 signal peptidase I [Arthrobacter crystallopoietes]